MCQAAASLRDRRVKPAIAQQASAAFPRLESYRRIDEPRPEACLAPVPTGNSRRERSRGEREGEACLAPTNMVPWYEEIQALWNNIVGATHASPPVPEERAPRRIARVSKDGHERDRASGHPFRRRFAPPESL